MAQAGVLARDGIFQDPRRRLQDYSAPAGGAIAWDIGRFGRKSWIGHSALREIARIARHDSGAEICLAG
jgi:hypothetical protein